MLKRLKKNKILFGLIVLVIAFGLYNRQAFPAIYSVISSYFQPIDIEYIKEQGGWLGTTGGIVRFDDNSETISGDTIYRNNEPITRTRSHLASVCLIGVPPLFKIISQRLFYSFTRKMRAKAKSTVIVIKTILFTLFFRLLSACLDTDCE
jgi:hypothetical protein